jgi:hypothetical protein
MNTVLSKYTLQSKTLFLHIINALKSEIQGLMKNKSYKVDALANMRL